MIDVGSAEAERRFNTVNRITEDRRNFLLTRLQVVL